MLNEIEMKKIGIFLVFVFCCLHICSQRTIVKRKQVVSHTKSTIRKQNAVKPNRNEIIAQLIKNMVYVEGGIFFMGTTNPEYTYSCDTITRKESVSDFYIGKYEVTQEEWEAVLEENPSAFRGRKRPVESINCYDCQKFIKRLNELTGRSFRLPTDIEWEYAARGGKYSKGYIYAGSNNKDEVAWFLKNLNYNVHTHNVGLKKPNELGLYDMSGNVEEICSTIYEPYVKPKDYHKAHPGPVLRGGSWYFGRTVFHRNELVNLENPYYNQGLRLVLDVK